MDNRCSMSGPRPAAERHVAVIGTGRWGTELVRAFDSLGVLRVVCDADAIAAPEELRVLAAVGTA